MNQEQTNPDQQAAGGPEQEAAEPQNNIPAEHENLKRRALSFYRLAIPVAVPSSPVKSILYAHLVLLGQAAGEDVPAELTAKADEVVKAWELAQQFRNRNATAGENEDDPNGNDDSHSCKTHETPDDVIKRAIMKIVESINRD